jgi:tRNA pseudouridine55 synthase
VVARVRRALGIRSVGHTGTLDPFATGLLLVLVGRATRLARFLEAEAKTYRATARLGVTTTTEDATGAEVARVEPERWPVRTEVVEAMQAMVGRQWQTPPAFSAKRVDGRRSYQLARAGRPVAPAPVEVTVETFDCLAWDPPHLEFRATVSAGTYVRSLARDLGDRLGLGAHLTVLRREAIGRWRVEDAVAVDAIGPGSVLIPPAGLLQGLPGVELTAPEAAGVAHGRGVPRGASSGLARLMIEGRLAAVAEASPMGWQPVVVLEAE